MLKFSADVKVNRPVEKVFAWLTNPDNQGKFDKSSLKMEALTPGLWRAGTQFRELRDLGGRKTEVLSEIAELEPNRLFSLICGMRKIGVVPFSIFKQGLTMVPLLRNLKNFMIEETRGPSHVH